MPLGSIAFSACTVVIWTEEYLETVFADGTVTPALFVVTPDTTALSADLGYGAHVRAMHYDHECAHTFLSEEIGRPYSFVLRRVASGAPWTYDQTRADEEAIVLAFQRYLNTGRSSPWLSMFPDVADVAGRFRAKTACFQPGSRVVFS